MLTVNQLKSMPAGTVFATGIVNDQRLANAPVKWMAKRGGYWDWTIYYHFDYMSNDYILSNGDKIFSDDIIEKLVPCDEEALKMYRK